MLSKLLTLRDADSNSELTEAVKGIGHILMFFGPTSKKIII